MLKKLFIPKTMTEQEWIEAISKKPKYLLSSNSKLSVAKIYNFPIPAAKAMIVKNGKLQKITTCPSAKGCLEFCYASSGCYLFDASMVKHAQNLSFAINHPQEFIEMMVKEIKSKRVLNAVRWHDSGDFYSKEYYMTMREVMLRLPEIKFYAYTKMLPLFEKLEEDGLIPRNFTYVFSYGGKHDDKIDVKKHRHSKIFTSEEELKRAGYNHSSMENGDLPASEKRKRKIGLVVHGSIGVMSKMKKNGTMEKKMVAG